MTFADLEYWMWLTLAFRPANPRKWNIISHYGSVKGAYEKISAGDYSRILPQDMRSVRSANMDQAKKMIDFCFSKGIRICSYGDRDYPNRLTEIYNPPSVLFYVGDISGIDESIVISAVGTRKPSDYSVEVGHKICFDLASSGVIIASGFALGLDSVAHRAALDAGGKTIAVLPCGILYPYPRENAGNRRKVARSGAVVSEFFPSDRPSSPSFQARNRVLSGISSGALIIQAGKKSGALSTANYAVGQGRDVFCIPPHDILSDDYAGNAELIREGAACVFSANDILNEYKGVYPHKLKSETVRHADYPDESEASSVPHNELKVKSSAAVNTTVTKASSLEESSDEKVAEPKINSANDAEDIIDIEAIYPVSKSEIENMIVRRAFDSPSDSLDGVKKQIYDFISENGEVHLDELAVGIGNVNELEAFLTELELDGLIHSLPGNRFSI